jgi:hypothetical protein
LHGGGTDPVRRRRLVGTALSATNGFLFTLSGFKNDGYSHGMATGFMVAFAMHFVLVCVLSVKLRRPAAA